VQEHIYRELPIAALSYPTITTLTSYTKRHNEQAQKHSVQLRFGESKFLLKLVANVELLAAPEISIV